MENVIMSELFFEAYEFLKQDSATDLYMPVIIESTFGKYIKPKKTYLCEFYLYLAELHKHNVVWDGSCRLTSEDGNHICKYEMKVRKDYLHAKHGKITITVFQLGTEI